MGLTLRDTQSYRHQRTGGIIGVFELQEDVARCPIVEDMRGSAKHAYNHSPFALPIRIVPRHSHVLRFYKTPFA